MNVPQSSRSDPPKLKIKMFDHRGLPIAIDLESTDDVRQLLASELNIPPELIKDGTRSRMDLGERSSSSLGRVTKTSDGRFTIERM